VFQLDTANEFWNMMASLNVADGSGKAVSIPSNVRTYFLSSNSHIGSTGLFSSPPGPLGLCQYPPHNFVTITAGYAPTARALVVALDQWADKGILPPPSNYPRLGSGLVAPGKAAASFPAIPGVSFPTVMNEFNLLDFGPEFNSQGGVETILPPLLGPSYELFVPKPDKDGLDVAGVRPMEIRAPIGTNVGWNIRAPGFREPNLCGLFGSFFPFAITKAQRLASGDPRKSLQERYTNHQGFVDAVKQATKELVHERFLLPEDAVTWIKAAKASNVLK
jgi:hypothetical protein